MVFVSCLLLAQMLVRQQRVPHEEQRIALSELVALIKRLDKTSQANGELLKQILAKLSTRSQYPPITSSKSLPSKGQTSVVSATPQQ